MKKLVKFNSRLQGRRRMTRRWSENLCYTRERWFIKWLVILENKSEYLFNFILGLSQYSVLMRWIKSQSIWKKINANKTIGFTKELKKLQYEIALISLSCIIWIKKCRWYLLVAQRSLAISLHDNRC